MKQKCLSVQVFKTYHFLGGKEGWEEMLGVLKKCPPKHVKICYFYAEIVKFGLISTHSKLF